MLFTLIVVTTDRFSLVERLFHSFVSQRYKNFAVLFVHGKMYGEEAQTITERFGGSLNVRTFASPSDSVSAARNLALSAVAGDVVAFPDDDCVYTPETLQTAFEIFSARPEADVLLGARTHLSERQKSRPAASVAAARIRSRYAAFRNSETFLQFYRTRCVRTVGPFDETLGPGTGLPYGSGEDTDYVLRAFAAGCAVFRAPGVVVAHPAPSLEDPGFYPKARSYAVGRMRLLHKHSMPLWFELANILYPLCRIPPDCLPVLRYRWTVFRARLGASIRSRTGGGKV
jgi:GT2 family glycosyltransferase